MIVIRLEAKETEDYKIDHSHFMVEFKKETRFDMQPQRSLIYYPSCKYKVSLYRMPGIVILSSYLPMYVLAWVIMILY
jgi:hypothetical protein